MRVWFLAFGIALLGCGESESSAPGAGGSDAGAGRGGSGGSTAGSGGSSGGTGGRGGSAGSAGTGGSAGGAGGSSGAAGSAGSGGAPDPAAPDWADRAAPGTWIEIGQNTIESLDPADDPAANPNHPDSPPWRGNTGQSCVTICWCGGAFASGLGPKGSFIAWCGGHNDYFGNEVYAFDMESELWSRLTNPYPNPEFPVTDGIWPDGTPSVPHTYGHAGYHLPTNSFTSTQTEVSNAGGVTAAVGVFLDLGTKRWRRGPRSPEHVTYGGWAAYDASRDAWWTEGGATGGGFARYAMNGDGTSGTWTNWEPKFNALDSMAVRDPAHDVLVIATFRQNTNLYGLDLTQPESEPVLLTQGGAPPEREGAHGWEWSELRQAFVYWRSGDGVYEVKLSGADWRTGSWNWTNLTSASNQVVPSEPTNGVYNRFRLARYAGTEIAVVVNEVDGKVFAFRMP